MKNKNYVFLIGHKSNVGKDEMAFFLKEKYQVSKISFADKLKSVVSDLYGFSHEQVYGKLKNVQDIRYPNNIDKDEEFESQVNWFTPRRILQIFGQQQRLIDSNIWARSVAELIKKEQKLLFPIRKNFCIPDFRFENEYHCIKNLLEDRNTEVKTIKIIRETDFFVGKNDISETALDNWDNWDFVLENNGDVKDYHMKIDNFYRSNFL